MMQASENYTFTMRGESMTRIETFVAASFAFAITMMVISLGTIPANMQEFILATKQIPAFTASCALIIWIWNTHAKWSRRFGLEDGPTIFFSSALIILVLIYIYPLRLMMQGLFYTLSAGYFPVTMKFNSVEDVRFMFAFYGLGFLLLCLNFIALYGYALKQRTTLKLSEVEIFDSSTEIVLWAGAAGVSVVSILISWLSVYISWSGFVFFALFPIMTGLGFYRGNKRKQLIAKLQQPSAARQDPDESQVS